jgi:hypothetical protein
VIPVPHFLDDLWALTNIFSVASPPTIVVRSVKVCMVVYGFGDASGKYFGSTLHCWDLGDDESSESSNWREFANVVEALEDEAEGSRF